MAEELKEHDFQKKFNTVSEDIDRLKAHIEVLNGCLDSATETGEKHLCFRKIPHSFLSIPSSKEDIKLASILSPPPDEESGREEKNFK